MEKLIVDNELCDGCQDCEKACEGVHGVPRITIHELDGSYFPIRCQQCEDAPCEIICPTGAMSNLGVDVTKCIACGFVQWLVRLVQSASNTAMLISAIIVQTEKKVLHVLKLVPKELLQFMTLRMSLRGNKENTLKKSMAWINQLRKKVFSVSLQLIQELENH